MKRLAIALILLAPIVAHGHQPIDWYPFWWQEGFPNAPVVRIWWADSDYANGGVAGWPARNAILSGFAAWNQAGSQMQFFEAGADWTLDYNSCRDYGVNGVWWSAVSGKDAVADVGACVFTDKQDRLWSWHMRFSPSAPWNTDATRAPRLGEVDLASFAAHEAGHSAGHWIHWDTPGGGATGLCPLSSSRHTMCGGQPAGKMWLRSLEKHDIHTFRLTYPKPAS